MKRQNLKAYTKVAEKISAYTTLPVEQWTHYELCGYLYSQLQRSLTTADLMAWSKAEMEAQSLGYGSDPKAGSPSRHPDIEMCGKVFALSGKNPTRTKEFVDWLRSERRLRNDFSISYLKYWYERFEIMSSTSSASNIPRNKELPSHLVNVISHLNSYTITYGDLCLLYKIIPDLLESTLASAGIRLDDLHLEKVL